MPGSFHGIETASRALRAFQRGLDTVGHNVANVDTPGYSRQRVDLATSGAIDTRQGAAISLGTGVTIAGISRIKDAFLTAQRLEAAGDMGRLEGGGDQLKSVEAAFLDTNGQGVSDRLDVFFASWSKLASNPSEPARRVDVQSAGRELAASVRSAYRKVAGAGAETSAGIAGAIADATKLTARIAELNAGIVAAKAGGGSPNDLMDERDRAIGSLGGIVDVTTSEEPNGVLLVNLGGMNLVDGAGSRGFPQSYDPATGSLGDGTNAYAVRGGSLRGLKETADAIKGVQGRLDTLANTLRTATNGLHAGGITGAGATGQNYFGDVAAGLPQTGAADLALDAAVEADARNIATGVSGASGDGAIALGLSRLKDAGQAALGGATLSGYHRDLAADVGRTVAARRDGVLTQEAVIAGIDARAGAISGVSTDEELTDMLRLQRSYQAAAKVLSTMDDMTKSLIDLLQR